MPSGIGTRVTVLPSGVGVYQSNFIRSASGNTPAPQASMGSGANPGVQAYAVAPGDPNLPSPGINPPPMPTLEPTIGTNPIDPNPVTVITSPGSQIATPAPGGLNNIPVIGNLLAGMDTMTIFLLIGAGIGIYYFAKR